MATNEDKTQKSRRAQTAVRRQKKLGKKVVGQKAIKAAQREADSRRKQTVQPSTRDSVARASTFGNKMLKRLHVQQHRNQHKP